ncbi:Transmembrane protein of unknown function [Propionibacterium cyclohexanicum]|uniref:DUF3566 domain-containing protein n=1 Tax=Propionibacterium cyclohexanicum TaxID=64702 RepID=A0A1H9TSB3_9ACTN|nr:DUF3566 domain-containing protein [Propionibacterium cyclohexanicum]SER99861.1 Transmembrane protein of unknown function [Propionibacterium cyclohexanicum]
MANDSATGSGGEPGEVTRTFGRPGEATSRPSQTSVSEQTATEGRPLDARIAGANVTLQPQPEPSASQRRRRPKVERPTRKARLRLARIDPWSVMKTAAMFSVAGGIILFVAVWALWGVIDASGVLSKMQEAITALIGTSSGSTSVQITNYVNQWRVLGFTAVVAVVDVILVTALCTLFSFLYNLAAQLIGGLEVTLAED